MKLWVAAASAALMFGCADRQAPNDAAASTVPDLQMPVFNGDSAFALLKRQVDFGPRVPGTAGHAAQLKWMHDYLAARADTVITQNIRHEDTDGSPVPMANLFARFNPSASRRILLVTHWDTRPTADQDPVAANRAKPILGANDGASGVAVLLVLADMLKTQAPPIGVDLLFTDGEDWEQGDMYIGAKHFASNLPPAYAPMYGILIDMVGDRNPVFPVEDYSQELAPEVVDRVWNAAAKLGLGVMFPRKPGGAVGDDHQSLNAAGIRTIDIIDGEYGARKSGTFGTYWHTLQDVVENTSKVGLEGVGRVLAYMVYSGG